MQFFVSQMTVSLISWVYPVTCPVTCVVGVTAKGQHVAVPFPHFLHPGAFLWQPRENFSALDRGKSFDLQISFFKFGSCLSAAIGESSKMGFKSGFLNSIALWCFWRTVLIFGRKGLKLKGAVNLLVCLSSCNFFTKEFFLFSSKQSPGRFLTFF